MTKAGFFNGKRRNVKSESILRGCILTRRERETVELYDRFSAHDLAKRFSTTPNAIWMRVYRARRKCPALRPGYSRRGRVRCASQIGRSDCPLNLDTLH